jgi:hypothetical protein
MRNKVQSPEFKLQFHQKKKKKKNKDWGSRSAIEHLPWIPSPAPHTHTHTHTHTHNLEQDRMPVLSPFLFKIVQNANAKVANNKRNKDTKNRKRRHKILIIYRTESPTLEAQVDLNTNIGNQRV